MAHIIRYNGYTTSATTRKQLNYTWNADPSMTPGLYDSWRTSVDIMLDASDENALASAVMVITSAWSAYNASFVISCGNGTIFEFLPGSDVGTMECSIQAIDMRGSYGKLRASFNFNLSSTGGGGGRKRGKYGEHWDYDTRGFQTVSYDRRERWDETTYSSARLQADQYLDNTFSFPDGKTLAQEGQSGWRLGPYRVDTEQELYPTGSAIASIWKWVNYSWNAHEKRQPHPTQPDSVSALLDNFKANVTQRFGKGTAFCARLDRTVTGSFGVDKDARNTLQTLASAEEVGKDWREKAEEYILKRYLPKTNWYRTELGGFQWSLDGRTCSFNTRGQAKSLVSGDKLYTRQQLITPLKQVPAMSVAGKFVEAHVNQTIISVRNIVKHEKTDGTLVFEEVARPFYRVSVQGTLTMINPGASDLIIKEPDKSDWESETIRVISFSWNPSLPNWVNDELLIQSVTFSAEFEVYDPTKTIDWKPMDIAADLIPVRRIAP